MNSGKTTLMGFTKGKFLFTQFQLFLDHINYFLKATGRLEKSYMG